MKTLIRLGLFLLAPLALPASASAYGCPLFPCVGNGHCHLGPWYLYFPYEAHFQMPAPVAPFPNWQAGWAPAYVPPAPAPTWQAPSPQPVLQPSSYVQPVSFPKPPSYWYGNR